MYFYIDNLSWYKGINRYIMECKLDSQGDGEQSVCELIDTLWNVNLVETMIFLLCQRINRYIMECK